MKRILACALAGVFLQGCASTDVTRITSGAVDGVFREMIGGVASDGVSSSRANASDTSGANQSYLNKERVSVTKPTRSSRDYGKITKLENRKNSKSQTRLALDSCVNARVGPMDCTVYVYEVAPDGRLIDDATSIRAVGDSGVVIASGTYYVKAVNNVSTVKHAVTGTLVIEPFVTNRIRLELE